MAQTQPCSCGFHQLTRARGKWGLIRWRRVVTWPYPGVAEEHGADVCWDVARCMDGPRIHVLNVQRVA